MKTMAKRSIDEILDDSLPENVKIRKYNYVLRGHSTLKSIFFKIVFTKLIIWINEDMYQFFSKK